VRPFDALRPISVTGRNGKFCARAKLPNSAMTTAILIGVQPMSFHPFRSTRMFLLWSKSTKRKAHPLDPIKAAGIKPE